MSGKNYFGSSLWKKKSEEERNEIVRILCERIDKQGKYIDEERLREIIINDWGVTDSEKADNLLDVVDKLPRGRLSLSRKAIVKLLPFMREGRLESGDPKSDALHAAGYTRPDERRWERVDFLPPLELKYRNPNKIGDEKTRKAVESLKNLPAITNPVVRQCLNEVRKLVNAIIREYGRPDLIRVELAREAKATSEQRKNIRNNNTNNQKANEEAENFILEQGYRPTFENKLRYRLWKEQGEYCPYTQKPISPAQLLGSETDIDHIIPRAQGGEDARMNKVVCFRSANEDKGNKTPWQWLSDTDPKRYEKILAAVKSLPYAKRMRFNQHEGNLDQFVNRQLNDTKYASRYVKQYLNLLYDNKDHVQCVRGNQTAALRHHWGLNNILHEDIVPDDLHEDQKNRADHRHHAVDALVIALTNAKIIQKLATWDKLNKMIISENNPLPPWPSREQFDADAAESIRAIIVSHAPQRRVRGQLHEDTNYGFVENRAPNDTRNLVRRKPLADLSASEVLCIRDQTIRNKVIDYLKEKHNIRINDKGTKMLCSNKNALKKALSQPFYLHPEEKRTIIKKVRILITQGTAVPLYPNRPNSPHIIPGKTHHIRIFEWIEKDKKGNDNLVRKVFFTTQMEVNQRLSARYRQIRRQMDELSTLHLSPEDREQKIREIRRNAEHQFPLVERTLSPEESRGHNAKFVMSLSQDETLEITEYDIDTITEENPKTTLVLYKTGAATQKQLYFSDIRSAYKKTKKKDDEQDDQDNNAEEENKDTSKEKSGKKPVERFSVSPKRIYRKVHIDILGNIHPARN
ncbi:MAG: type II CRISPR RNA-guided endonuclease Cas9 [Planctomycetia bacterium]|nr:type II CRISPR RNA-guided endonuclease Cas9 [Planctomycetia bacterium]